MNSCPTCGRRLDRNWSECPYCKREREAKSAGEVPASPPEEKTSMADKIPRNPTRVEPPVSGRETKYQPPFQQSERQGGALQPETPGVRLNAQDNRKIIGVLATYTWRAEGELFPVREGRTHIGAGQIKDDNAHRQVEVFCPSDELLSEDHAMILVQQKKFWIRDLDSTNGTFVNGEQLRPDAAEELTNNAEIKTGKTVFTFLKIEPNSAVVTEARPEHPRQAKEPEAPPSRDKTILR
jgi:hypothetical protein